MISKAFVLIILIVFCVYPVLSIGISPAIKKIDFQPGKEVNITFYVLDAIDSLIYDVSLIGGSLSPYSSVSANTVTGNGVFTLTIDFPEKIDPPGDHSVSVSIKERPSESSFISTVVEIGSVIKTFVPYPGIYGDLSLNIPDGNVDSKIPVELHVINRGDNPLEIKNVFIDFISDDKLVDSMNFTPVTIPVSGDRYFRKYLDTTGIGPGDYIGKAIIYYGNTTNEINKSFRVGSLFVNITNFTTVLTSGKIQKFQVYLENRWNSPIQGAYVDVNISNIGESYLFRTPSIDLQPWEEKVVESYFDVGDLKGNYNIILNATYNGKSTVAYGNILVEEDHRFIIYTISAIIAIIFFIGMYFLVRPLIKRGNKK